MFAKILCATDGSGPSLKAATIASDIRRKYGATLTLMHVAPLRVLDLMQPHGSMGGEDLLPRQVEERLAAASHQVIQATLAHLGEAAQGVQTREILGHPGDEICLAAQEYDLLVIGDKGQSGLARALMGSVSGYVAHHCKPPLLVVKEDADASPSD